MFRHSPIQPPSAERDPAIFYFVDNKLLVEMHGEEAQPAAPGTAATLPGIGRTEVIRDLFVGMLDETPCHVVELRVEKPDIRDRQGADGEDRSGDEEYSLVGLRSLLGRMDEEILKAAGVASQVLDWDRNHRYCGRCGTETVRSERERSRTCPSCSLTAYPRISPAMIVAVLKEDKILLAHNRRHRTGHVFSVLAGFVEPGESLEECVRREVMEEVSIELGEIRYFASQPWPFPDSLMIAFTADYKAGAIDVDGTEIVEAGWYDRDHLPAVPPHGTVARRLIDWFVETRRSSGASR